MSPEIIVIGASAGGVEAIRNVVSNLPGKLAASIFVVLHIPPEASNLPEILNRVSAIPALQPEDRERVRRSRIYIAPPDKHLLLENGIVRVVRGPKENRHRPAIDPLFRSAARAYGKKVVGIILSGTMHDGVAGLHAVKRVGGITIVQDPQEALFPSLPMKALGQVDADHQLDSHKIGHFLAELIGNNPKNPEEAGNKLASSKNKDEKLFKSDTLYSEFNMDRIEDEKRPGEPSVFSCPDCKGVLWELKEGDLVRYRCRVGHGFTQESMSSAQSEKIDEALWVALTTLEESASLSKRIAASARARNQNRLSELYESKVKVSQQRADVIRDFLIREEPQSKEPLLGEDKEGLDSNSAD